MGYTKEEQKEHREDLVYALRSGKYNQGRRALLYKDNYCCLGVACDISGLGEWVKDENTDIISNVAYVVREDGSESTVQLPGPVSDYFGIDDNGNYFNEEGAIASLISKNDTYDLTFEEIADIIESEPKWYSDG